MRRRVTFLILLCISSFIFGNIRTEAAESKEFTGTVNKVVDGDTIYLNEAILGTKKVRFLHIDTPETYHRTSYNDKLIKSHPDHSQKYHGEAAKTYLQTLLKPGDTVTLKLGEKTKDYYGRLLAQVIRKSDKMNINLQMVRKGYAVTYFISPFGDVETYYTFQQAVKKAFHQQIGIWNRRYPLLELPLQFRIRDHQTTYTKYVGNSDTKEYFPPSQWQKPPIDKRIFFREEADAVQSGYRKAVLQKPAS